MRDEHARSALPTLGELGFDLVHSTHAEVVWVLAKPVLLTCCFVVAAALGWWPLAPLIVFLLFVSIVSSAHDTVHGSLGLSRKASDWALFALGALMLESGHAYRQTHLRHHAVFPGDDDPEGAPAKMTAWGAVAAGPTFLFRLWLWAWRRSEGSERRWLFAEAAWALSVTASALMLALLKVSAWPLAYVLMVGVGSWVYPLLTSHLPHRHYGDTPLTQTHTLRGHIVPALFSELTYHLEHHLYPKVPTHHLPELSRRLTPTFQREGVQPWRVP
jgi:beta-carotene hydroxylase